MSPHVRSIITKHWWQCSCSMHLSWHLSPSMYNTTCSHLHYSVWWEYSLLNQGLTHDPAHRCQVADNILSCDCFSCPTLSANDYGLVPALPEYRNEDEMVWHTHTHTHTHTHAHIHTHLIMLRCVSLATPYTWGSTPPTQCWLYTRMNSLPYKGIDW